MKKIAIEQLVADNKAECPHLEHVTKLAETIFDAVKEQVGLSNTDRNILYTAAMLHDIAFASNPDKHAQASAKLISTQSIRGLTHLQRDYVAAVTILHRRKYKPFLKNSAFLKCIKQRQRALLLAAILRVADGLDHSHVQDCHIRKITVTTKSVSLYIHSRWYPQNGEWALGKADLWSEVFPLPLRIIEAPSSASKLRYKGLLQKDDTVIEAFRSLLYSQYRLYLDNIPGTCRGDDPEFLHDLRVALRRASMLFPFFKPVLSQLEYKGTRQFIKKLTKELGPFRDDHVWFEFITRTCRQLGCEEHPKWQRLIAAQRRKDRRDLPRLIQTLTHPENIKASRNLSVFLRSELPHLDQTTPFEGYSAFAAQRLNIFLNDLLQRRMICESDHPETAHDLRKLIRKMRYYAEYAEPVLPALFSDLTQHLKAVADAMGAMHDMDVHLERMKRMPEKIPRSLTSFAKKKRAQAWIDYQTAWIQLTDHTFQKKIYKSLNRIIP